MTAEMSKLLYSWLFIDLSTSSYNTDIKVQPFLKSSLHDVNNVFNVSLMSISHHATKELHFLFNI